MNWLKRIMLIFIAAVLLVSAAVSAYAAGSPVSNKTTTLTTDDGVTVTLYKMPENLNMLSEQTKTLYAAFIEMAKAGTIVLYMAEVQEGKHKGEVLVMTEFPQRSAILDDKNRTDMNTAYTEVKQNEDDLSKLNPDIKEQAAAAGVPVEDCKVTDIFDLTYYKKTDIWRKSDDHGKINVTVSTEKLKNFVGLQHRNNGKWETVKDAKVTGAAKDTLTFSATELSPFAIVTWGEEGIGSTAKQSPKTGDNTLAFAGTIAFSIVMLSAAVYVLTVAVRRKNSKNQ